MTRSLPASLALLAALLAAPVGRAGDDIETVVTKLVATFEPAEAKPGQLVTLKLTVEIDPAWWTYPTAQPEKGAASFVNKFIVPREGALLGVGKPVDPANPKSKEEPVIPVDKLLYYPGGGTYELKFVVSPKATPGVAEAKVGARLTVCNPDKCLAGKFDVTAKLKVLDGPAVEVDPAHRAEVEKLLQAK